MYLHPMSPHYLVKLKNNTETADYFLQFILSNQLFVTFTESCRCVFVFPILSNLLKIV